MLVFFLIAYQKLLSKIGKNGVKIESLFYVGIFVPSVEISQNPVALSPALYVRSPSSVQVRHRCAWKRASVEK
jgi:hypothetical protein